MNNIFDMENLKNKLELYKIEDEKNKYVFRANLRYMISSSIFFIIIVIIAGYSLYKLFLLRFFLDMLSLHPFFYSVLRL